MSDLTAGPPRYGFESCGGCIYSLWPLSALQEYPKTPFEDTKYQDSAREGTEAVIGLKAIQADDIELELHNDKGVRPTTRRIPGSHRKIIQQWVHIRVVLLGI